MTSMSKDFKILKKKLMDICLLMVPLELLSHYPDIAMFHWLGDDFQWIMYKVFGEKFVV